LSLRCTRLLLHSGARQAGISGSSDARSQSAVCGSGTGGRGRSAGLSLDGSSVAHQHIRHGRRSAHDEPLAERRCRDCLVPPEAWQRLGRILRSWRLSHASARAGSPRCDAAASVRVCGTARCGRRGERVRRAGSWWSGAALRCTRRAPAGPRMKTARAARRRRRRRAAPAAAHPCPAERHVEALHALPHGSALATSERTGASDRSCEQVEYGCGIARRRRGVQATCGWPGSSRWASGWVCLVA
jgi:hypothetical protein